MNDNFIDLSCLWQLKVISTLKIMVKMIQAKERQILLFQVITRRRK